MGANATHATMTEALGTLAESRGVRSAIICTDQGLLMAGIGETEREEALAGYASLFDAVVARGARDLGWTAIDEVSVADAGQGRIVMRPLVEGAVRRVFLVVVIDGDAPWRRATRRFTTAIRPWLLQLVALDDETEATRPR